MGFSPSVCLLALAISATPAPSHRVILISLDGFPAYALADPKAPIPSLRKLAAEGVVAQGMQTVNPSVTWPNHTTLVTGVDARRHGVIFNGKILRHGPAAGISVDEHPLQADLIHIPTLYDLAHQAGLVTAEVAWPATREAKAIDWSFPENPDPDGIIEKELIAQGIVTRAQLKPFDGDQTWRDEIETAAADDILAHHTPSLLLLHLTATDSIQHKYGPHTDAATMAYAFEDDRVAHLLDTLHRLNLEAGTTIFVVSDHGFRKVQHLIRLNSLLVRQGFSNSAVTISHGGLAMLYISDPAQRTRLLPALRARLATVEGVKQTFASDAFPALQLPSPENTQTPDLVLEAKIGYAFDDDDPRDSAEIVIPTATGEHGYLSSDPDMDALFIASGPGIRKGVQLGRISNLDVAPTIAQLLNLDMRTAGGRPLVQILTRTDTH